MAAGGELLLGAHSADAELRAMLRKGIVCPSVVTFLYTITVMQVHLVNTTEPNNEVW